MSRGHNLKMGKFKGKPTTFQKALVGKVSRHLYLTGGSMLKQPEVHGSEAIRQYVPNPRDYSKNIVMVLNYLKTFPRTWQFWAAIFYYDDETGEKTFSSIVFDPIVG